MSKKRNKYDAHIDSEKLHGQRLADDDTKALPKTDAGETLSFAETLHDDFIAVLQKIERHDPGRD